LPIVPQLEQALSSARLKFEASTIWSNTMAIEQQDVETLDICNLEYDVASIGAGEASAAEGKQPAYLVFYKLPERS
jgi:hypothetical protein